MSFSVISWHCDVPGDGRHPSRKTGTHLCHAVNSTVFDNLVTLGTGVSEVIVPSSL